MRSVYELLDTSESLLRAGWVAGREAVDKDGHSVDPWSDLAIAYCVLGSVRAVTYYEVGSETESRYTKFIMSVVNMASSGIMKYGRVEKRNDATNQEEAVLMVHRAKEYVQSHFGENYIPNWLKILKVSH